MGLSKLSIKVNKSVAQLTWQQAKEPVRHAPSIPFDLEFEETEELKWYTKDYNGKGDPESEKRARKIEREMKRWGRRLFATLFHNPISRDALIFFHEAIRSGLDNCDFVISSDDPKVLNLPWELMYSPDYQFLVPQFNGMYRSLNHKVLHAPLPQLSKTRLHILLVISRPNFDLPPGVFARPLIRILYPLIRKGIVRLKVLRPPTFAELDRELSENKGVYHIVHFDGHGNLGNLVFERPGKDEGPDFLTAKRIGQSLRNCRVPIFILDACHSGLFVHEKPSSSGEQTSGMAPTIPISSIASQLLSLGAKTVVAMGYVIHVDASRDFMVTFYKQLLRGKSVAQGVTAGRRLLLSDPERNTKYGPVNLQDWMIPVLYQQETYIPFAKSVKGKPSFREAVHAMSESRLERNFLIGVPDQGPIGFIGRDFELLHLERLFQESNLVLLHSLKGDGKTAFSAEAARWLVRTSGRERVFYMSFRDDTCLRHVLAQIGETLMGSNFDKLETETKKRSNILKYLRKHPCLLIWDQFERVVGRAKRRTNFQEERKHEELSAFVRKLQYSQTWVLIVSRMKEKWLRCRHRQFYLGGFLRDDSIRFAAEVLEQAEVPPKNALYRAGDKYAFVDKDVFAIVNMLCGNPLCLQEELPKLSERSARELVEEIQNELEKNDGIFFIHR